jgi:Uma2 family endonuclease
LRSWTILFLFAGVGASQRVIAGLPDDPSVADEMDLRVKLRVTWRVVTLIDQNPEGALVVGIPVIDTSRMDAGPKDTGPMTVDEFYAFTDTRPDEEKWELIGGEPILNAAPSLFHQLIVGNVVFTLMAQQRETKAAWRALSDLGVRISEKDRPEPDVLVFPFGHRRPDGRRDLNDVIVVFEVPSPSTEKRDLGWKRKAYASLASHPLHRDFPGRGRSHGVCPR